MLEYHRSKRVGIWTDGPQRLVAHGMLDDDLYSLEVQMTIDPSTREIRAVKGWWNRWTAPDCPMAADLLQDAVGLRIDQPDLAPSIQKSVGRKACRHYANILIECCYSAREALTVLRFREAREGHPDLTFRDFLEHGEAPPPSSGPANEEKQEATTSSTRSARIQRVSAASLKGPVIDLHLHTSPASPCSSAPVDDLIREARRIGLDGICLTDHNYVWRPEDVEALRQRHGFLVLRGNEITTDEGDILVFGFDRDVQGIIRLQDLRPQVVEAGGFMIAAHPFRGFLTFGVGKLGLTPEKAMKRPVFQYVDAVEVLNGKVTADENRFSGEVADALGITITGGKRCPRGVRGGPLRHAVRFSHHLRGRSDRGPEGGRDRTGGLSKREGNNLAGTESRKIEEGESTMENSSGWEPLIRKMERLLRLRSFPVAFKLLEKTEELDSIPFMRRPSTPMTLCQMTNLVRNFDWTVGADDDDFVLDACPAMLGFREKPGLYQDGSFRSIVWVKNREDGKKYEDSIPRLPMGRYQALAMAPLVYDPFEPDIVLIYGNPAQMILIINALQLEDYEVMEFFCVGESSCSDVIARCYLNGKPSLSIPCYGERRYGHTQDDEMVIAIPAGSMEKLVNGLDTLYRRGVRYPISFAGAESDILNHLPPAYNRLDYTAQEIRGDGQRLLLGVTGGIASGKSAVSTMLEELGSPIIDFDILAREVVEPGQPAYDQIVDYFGRQVLLEDGTLDRKAISAIVFRDMEKRKKLESFTHPAIYDRFAECVKEITDKDPEAIIQVSIPLLIELNLQYMFHKLLVVHIPYEEQVQRLMGRDGNPGGGSGQHPQGPAPHR